MNRLVVVLAGLGFALEAGAGEPGPAVCEDGWHQSGKLRDKCCPKEARWNDAVADCVADRPLAGSETVAAEGARENKQEHKEPQLEPAAVVISATAPDGKALAGMKATLTFTAPSADDVVIEGYALGTLLQHELPANVSRVQLAVAGYALAAAPFALPDPKVKPRPVVTATLSLKRAVEHVAVSTPEKGGEYRVQVVTDGNVQAECLTEKHHCTLELGRDWKPEHSFVRAFGDLNLDSMPLAVPPAVADTYTGARLIHLDGETSVKNRLAWVGAAAALIAFIVPMAVAAATSKQADSTVMDWSVGIGTATGAGAAIVLPLLITYALRGVEKATATLERNGP